MTACKWVGHVDFPYNQDRSDHFAVFGDENVVGAAGGRGVHEFDADAGLDEFAVQVGMGEMLFGTGAEQQYFRFQLKKIVEMRRGQRWRNPWQASLCALLRP